jgi:glycosyltransferase involved in cell wall biosynthesis
VLFEAELDHLLPLPRTGHLLLILQSTAVGGMETHCVDLAAEYVRRGNSLSVIIPEAPSFDDLAARFRMAGSRVDRLDTDGRAGRLAQFANSLRLVKILVRLSPDGVHLHTGGSTGGLAVVAAARSFTHAAVVVTEHDVPIANSSWHDRTAKRVMDLLVHRVVAVSRRNATLRTQRIGAPAHRFAAILNGVPVREVSSTQRLKHRRCVRADLGLSDADLVVGSLVRLAEGKGLHDLLRAFSLARAAQPSELLLVGDGPLRERLQALAKQLDVAEHVHFVGQQDHPAVYLDAMDAFVLAVPTGSMSIALLEAMARGLPSVITFCGPEEAVIAEETGLCAPPNDPTQLAQVLVRITRDAALRARLGAAAAEHVRNHFSVQRVANDLLELYATARAGSVPDRLRASGPPDPRPGGGQPVGDALRVRTYTSSRSLLGR